MKNILFVINTLGVGGAERALLELLDTLDSGTCTIDLYVLLGRGELMAQVPEHVRLLNGGVDSGSVQDAAGRRMLAAAVASSFFRNGNWAGKLGSVLRALPPMLRRRRLRLDKLLWRVVSDGAVRPEREYDTAVAWIEGGAAYFVADYVRAKKKLAVVHIDYEKSGYTRAMDQNCWAQFQKIFLVSEEIREPFLRVYPECRDRVQELPNLVNQEKIRHRAQEPGGFADGYSGMRLLSVGRLTYQKAFEIAIDAMKLLKDAGYQARWYVLGEGDLRGKLERKIAALGLEKDFVLLGAVENPYPYYAQADIYIHATRFEGRSIAIQEAQTLGCPIVASDVSGNRIQIVQNQDGLLCSLEPGAIAQSIGVLLSDDTRRKRLGRAAMAKQTATQKEIVKLLEF
ncbi:glycosyltransferase [Pseudoflavonifractor sp. 524-17]|uniref:glycosyltransferase n=1 Tax=Pseudoflavonifractor sp. 524-17 TaxID=2304577 RepID=UPI001379B6F3|nr:glycosyltransferase [Pseudoflavonifractor sp. 524-17]NCE65346.1 glycosyltransferase [Pseudoflavonifractor sp. 524-17]